MANKNENQKNQLKQIAALSGIAIQMGVTIYLFVLLGKWIDSKFDSESKVFLIVFTLLGVGIALYAVLKQINKLNP
ncbi:AtpZ/AtpI family protein [Tamlana fucoidanivorans]|uniref:AtpZ/AtpI family protein n=1 Tax=Allotamlana fucoidanivorans TaxID=2583814 RepID=A0A5C4SRJ3_9FLAO|nr:AtpZ/AtpI family protein [Tamlana fucoidanivorans]TNJ47023.1 AtpZ/AtpI family protein [Tamlana fucoidanivorans]